MPRRGSPAATGSAPRTASATGPGTPRAASSKGEAPLGERTKGGRGKGKKGGGKSSSAQRGKSRPVSVRRRPAAATEQPEDAPEARPAEITREGVWAEPGPPGGPAVSTSTETVPVTLVEGPKESSATAPPRVRTPRPSEAEETAPSPRSGGTPRVVLRPAPRPASREAEPTEREEVERTRGEDINLIMERAARRATETGPTMRRGSPPRRQQDREARETGARTATSSRPSPPWQREEASRRGEWADKEEWERWHSSWGTWATSSSTEPWWSQGWTQSDSSPSWGGWSRQGEGRRCGKRRWKAQQPPLLRRRWRAHEANTA